MLNAKNALMQSANNAGVYAKQYKQLEATNHICDKVASRLMILPTKRNTTPLKEDQKMENF
jgi:hypothetical protein